MNESGEFGVIDSDSFWKAPEFAFSPKAAFSQNCVSVWKSGQYNSTVQIIFSGLAADVWSFDRVGDPVEMLAAICDFVRYFGVYPSFPIRTTQKLFDRLGSSPEPVEDFDLESYFEQFLIAPDNSQIWIRDCKKPELSKSVTGFDKRAMYLSASSGLKFGRGRYEKIDAPNLDFVLKHPGLYEIEISYKKPSDPFNRFFNSGLCYSQLVEVALDFCEVRVIRGWYWPEYARVFDPFYSLVSRVKRETTNGDPVQKIVNGAAKSLYTSFFGFMRKREIARSEYLKHWFRPDFRGFIVAQAIANLIRNIKSVYDLTGRFPVGILHDCVFYSGAPADFAGTVLDSDRFSFEFEVESNLVFTKSGKVKLSVAELNNLGKRGDYV